VTVFSSKMLASSLNAFRIGSMSTFFVSASNASPSFLTMFSSESICRRLIPPNFFSTASRSAFAPSASFTRPSNRAACASLTPTFIDFARASATSLKSTPVPIISCGLIWKRPNCRPRSTNSFSLFPASSPSAADACVTAFSVSTQICPPMRDFARLFPSSSIFSFEVGTFSASASTCSPKFFPHCAFPFIAASRRRPTERAASAPFRMNFASAYPAATTATVRPRPRQ
jgi:hypothetical protein